MAAGNFRPEDIEQARKCREEILTLLSDSDDIGAQKREVSHLNSKVDKARDLERRQFKILVAYQLKGVAPFTPLHKARHILTIDVVYLRPCVPRICI